ncbi:MBL fold metallo-hydrolase [Candidatus Nanohalococcus occultus]|uniref:Rhodanese-related sulfurtransferase n=1 Tax=Candidatus Nanohalococcus occultus TaxID=2978047 RepID=A0ABY8CIU1_9ARCH|nr:Rhodanese-related sulfurtransferase [Candidatus Nanohaloarchaeota archaeon SVXNc]
MKSELPDTDQDVESVKPTQLKRRIDSGDKTAILDVRNQNDFEQWRLEGENLEAVNIPYFEFLDGEIEELVEKVPENPVVLCAKGESSEYIAALLKQNGIDAKHLEDGMYGWAGIYEKHRINEEPLIFQYQRPSSGCLGYMVISEGQAAVIDPLRAFTERYSQDAEKHGAQIKYVLDTHVHADHISGLRELAENTDAEPVMSEKAVERGVTYSNKLETVQDGDRLAIGETEIEVIETPGHTTGMVSYKVDKVVFTGDGLFTESVARPDLEEGEAGAEKAAKLLYSSLHDKILGLEDQTVVAPAHFSAAAEVGENNAYIRELGDLKHSMEALEMEKQEFVRFVVSDMPPRPANYEEIIETNLGVKQQSDEQAFELELGPNNCAASKDSMT